MKSDPWLIIIGMDGGGFDKLAQIAKQHITSAQYIIGPKRHLSMLPSCDAILIEWPTPFSKGIEIVLSKRGPAMCHVNLWRSVLVWSRL